MTDSEKRTYILNKWSNALDIIIIGIILCIFTIAGSIIGLIFYENSYCVFLTLAGILGGIICIRAKEYVDNKYEKIFKELL